MKGRQGIRSYRGLWQASPGLEVAAQATSVSEPAIQLEPELPPPHFDRPVEAALTPERLGKELLQEPRLGFGEFLLLWFPFSSRSWSAWAHGRIFALACYGSFELPEEALRRLRGPLAGFWYRKSSLALVRMLILVEPSAKKSRWLRPLRWVPPVFVWAFERQLQRTLSQSQFQSQSQSQSLSSSLSTGISQGAGSGA